MSIDLGPWEPLTPVEVTDLLCSARFPWWIAGGWAIDLHLGRQTRQHGDIDVLVLREDLAAMQRILEGWDLHAADPPGMLRRWGSGEVLPPSVHDIWCRRDPTAPWSLQVMVDDATDGTWTYRRDRRIERPVEELDGGACGGRPRVLAPEVQLLHKSASTRPKDEVDFRTVLERLGPTRRVWLARSLALTSPAHPWLARL
jgi:hypothetical protein